MEIVIQSSDHLDHYLMSLFKRLHAEGVCDFLIPAGGTPESFYKLMREQFKTLKDSDFSQIHLWQIDEILNGNKENHFHEFFKEHLGPWMGHFHAIRDSDGGPFGRYASFLGLGVNGHVAFHEPHIPSNFSLGCVELGQETCEYLDLNKGTWGLTFGLETFLKSEKIILMVKGHHKAQVLKRFMEDDQTLPAVVLKNHPGLILLADKEAFSGIDFRDSSSAMDEGQSKKEAC